MNNFLPPALQASTPGIEPLESRIAPAATVFKVFTLKDITDLQNHASGSLRDAIYNANHNTGDSVIEFVDQSGHPLHGTINLGSDLPVISLLDPTDTLTITGPISGKSNGLILNGHNHQILQITKGNVSMSDFSVTHGQAILGGGVYINDNGAQIDMKDLTISGNRALSTDSAHDADGGGIFILSGTVSIEESKIIGNAAIGAKGTATSQGGYVNGGGICSHGTLTIVDSLISGNVAQAGSALGSSPGYQAGGAYGGGVYGSGHGTTVIVNSVISGNKVIAGNGSSGHKGTTGTPGGPGLNGGNGGIGQDGGNGGIAEGGGVYCQLYSSMTITGSTISGNTLQGGKGGNGGAGGKGGAGGNSYTNSSFHHEGAGGNGGTGGKGGAQGGAFGAGAYSSGTLTIQNSTISGNSAHAGKSGAGGAGGAAGSGSYTIANVVYKGTNGSRGAVGQSSLGYGGGVFSTNALDLSQVTIAKNSSTGTGGGIGINQGTVQIHNCTIAYNKSASGGGVSSFNSGNVDVVSSIIASNSAQSSPDILGTFNATNDLLGTTTGANFLTDTGNRVNVSAQLGALKMNGGLTATILPALTSPAVDHGSNPDSLVTDQRGTNFPRVSGVAIDIGAVEVG